MHLRCNNRSCAHTLDLHERAVACPVCGDLLEVVVQAPAMDTKAMKRMWVERRMSNAGADSSGVWRFRDLLPGPYSPETLISLAEGNTPLVRGLKTAASVGLDRLFFKHLGWNPTGCFKDLGMTVGMTEAKHVGAKIVACASTGNTSASLAAYASRAGLEAQVYLPSGKISLNKLAQALDFGAKIVEVDGNFDAALDQLLATPNPDIYFLNSVNPFRVEGQKTVMIEMLEQLDWQVPDYVICPGGNLGNSSAFGKALEELKEFGFIDRVPKLIVVQAAGANPFYKLWHSGVEEITPSAHPETVASAIRIGNPRSWRKALHAVKFTGGFVMEVTDEEIGEAKTLIGLDGIGCEPASATTLAGLRKLHAQRKLESDATVVAILTGHALKDTDYILKSHAHWRDTQLAEVRK
ncbi:MAG TPA: threonine synthase [Candidatus Koribacter sp.]|jgi:threonine synthase